MSHAPNCGPIYNRRSVLLQLRGRWQIGSVTSGEPV